MRGARSATAAQREIGTRSGRTGEEEHDGLVRVEEQRERLPDHPCERDDEPGEGFAISAPSRCHVVGAKHLRNDEEGDLLGTQQVVRSKLDSHDYSRLMALTILEPTATPKLRSILSLTETVTAVTCSEDEKSANVIGPSDRARATHLLRFLRWAGGRDRRIPC